MGRITLYVRPRCRFCPKVVRRLREMIKRLEEEDNITTIDLLILECLGGTN